MIVTVTANASIDKRYVMGALEPGKVNRVANCTMSAGGKGLNVARAAAAAGETVMTTGFLGGHHGRYIQEALRKEGIGESFVWCEGETRSCINIWDEAGQQTTELLEPGMTVTRENMDELLRVFSGLAVQADAIAVSGSLPQGADTELYRSLIRIGGVAGKKVILDTGGKTLRECVSSGPYMVKPNLEELGQLTGKVLQAGDQNRILSAAKELRTAGTEVVVVSLGSDGAVMACGTGCYEVRVPPVHAVNTVGCGDALTGGFCVGLSRGLETVECLRLASAYAAASAMTERTGFFNTDDMKAVFREIRIKRIG